MKIVLKKLMIENFKGLIKANVEFNYPETTISGANGTGKTTIFDSVTWLLFGKDSLDRKEFNVKPLKPDGKTHDQIEISVEGIFMITEGDDLPYKMVLKRVQSEIWTKPRGQNELVFKGNESTYFINGVPHTMKDYNIAVARLCPEETFRLITNPRYFPLLPWKTQRQMLFKFAGDVTDEDIFREKPEFNDILKLLTGKTLEGLRKEIANDKRRIREELEGIPPRIDELNKSLPQEQHPDADKYPKKIEGLEKEIKRYQDLLSDKSKASEETMKDYLRKQADINQITIRQQEIEITVESILQKGKTTTQGNLENLKARKGLLTSSLHDMNETIQRKNSRIEEMRTAKADLLAEYQKIKAEEFVLDDSMLVCPTCRRTLDDERKDLKKLEMQIKFNNNKTSRLNENIKNGKDYVAKISLAEADLEKLTKDRNESLEKLEKLNAEIIAEQKTLDELRDVDYGQMTRELLKGQLMSYEARISELVKEWQNNENRIHLLRTQLPDLNQELTKEKDTEETAGINAMIEEKSSERDRLNAALVVVAQITKTLARIEQLKKEQIRLVQELSSLEATELRILEFDKAKIDFVETRVNGMFKKVRFKLFNTLINGMEEPTCELTINGVPYSDLNNAGRINAGLDIIQAVNAKENVYAPIFIDNREAVNEIVDLSTQVVNLRVTFDKTLIIN